MLDDADYVWEEGVVSKHVVFGTVKVLDTLVQAVRNSIDEGSITYWWFTELKAINDML